MSDARIDEQAAAETLDDDKLSEEFPPDRPMGVDEYGVTASEELVDEPLADRVAREVPEPLAAPEDDAVDTSVGTLVDTDEGGRPDTEKDAVASEARVADFRTGGADPDDIAIGDEDLRDVATERVEDTTAEEAAMHLTDEPPMHDTDGYLDQS
jgi:hypothetical protein